MDIKLKQLELNNYRNIKHQVLNFNGSSKIVGENRVGKTNTLEALYWLLTDKLLNGSKDIEQIKSLEDTKNVVSVTAIFEVGDKTISLGKEFSEEWVKARGSDELIFKGHTTTYIYNGVKQGTKKGYDALFNEDFGINTKNYIGIDIIQLLINPLYLGKMGDTDDWKNLRTMIIDIVGDVKDSDVFAENTSLLPIEKDLETFNGRTDQVIKSYRDAIKTINEDIIGCDANIKMLQESPSPSQEMYDAAKKMIEECDANISQLKADTARDKALNLIDEEINKLKSEIIDEKRNDLERKKNNPFEKRKNELQEKRVDIYSKNNQITNLRSDTLSKFNFNKIKIDNNETLLNELQVKRLNLIDELQALDKQIESPDFEKECPHCHRPYDDDKIEESKQVVLKSLQDKRFNLICKGKENTERMNQIKEEIESLKKNNDNFTTELARLESTIEINRKELEEIDAELTKIATTDVNNEVVNPRIVELENQIKDKQIERTKIVGSINDEDNKIRELIVNYQKKKEQYQNVVTEYEFAKRVFSQINDIKAKKKDFQEKLIRTESNIELVKLFVKTKLEMLDENISKVFDDIKFMLIEPQINGGYSPVCKPYIKGTSTLWKSGSKSEQLTTGVAIAEKIKTALNLPNFPYLFDEGGEVSTSTFNSRFETKSQLICVQVKDNINIPTVMNI